MSERVFGDPRGGARRLLVSVISMLLLAAGLAPTVAEAQGGTSTVPLDQICTAEPQATVDATAAGVPGAVVGEFVSFTQVVDFPEGTVYQDILERADGSQYYASMLEISQVFDVDPGHHLTVAATPTLLIDGSPAVTIPGTQPDPDDFVLHTITGPGGEITWRVYFPGDVALMLAEQSGNGLPSYEVPAGGQVFEFSFDAQIDDDPAVISGSVLDGATCFASVSTGPTNRNTERPIASVAVIEPHVDLVKASTASGGVVTAGGIAGYEITLTNPGLDDTGVFPTADAHDVTVVDTLPAALTPVDETGTPLADGESTPSGGVWDEGARTLTWTIPIVASGDTTSIVYDVLVDTDTNASTPLTNTAVVDVNSLPDDLGGGRLYDDIGTDAVTVGVGADVPIVDKTGWYKSDEGLFTFDTDLGGPLPVGFTFYQTVEVTLQPDSDYHNVTVSDVLPDGLTFLAFDGATCEIGSAGPGSCPAPAGQTLTPAALPSGITPLLWYIGDVSTGAAPVTYAFEYRVEIAETDAVGSAPLPGDEFTNTVDLLWNNIDRLGPGVTPQPGALPPSWDGEAADETTVAFDRPILELTKRDLELVEPADLDDPQGPIRWEIVITNVGGMSAVNVDIVDNISSDLTFVGVDVGASTGAVDLVSTSGPLEFRIEGPIAAGDSFVLVYETRVAGTGASNQISTNLADAPCYRNPFRPKAEGEDCFDDVSPGADSVSYLYSDVSVSKSLSAAPPQSQSNPFSSGIGGPIWFTITLENTGLGTAHEPQIEDVAPDGFCAVAGSPTQADGTTPEPSIRPSNTTSSTFELDGIPDIAPGETFTFHYAITPCGPVDDSAFGSEYENDAYLSYFDGLGNTVLDGVPYETDDDEAFEILSPTFELTKTTSDTALAHDFDATDADFEIVAWDITVTNTSATQWAYGLEIVDELPDGLLYDLDGTAGPGVATAVYTGTPTPAVGAAPWFDDDSGDVELLFGVPALGPGHSITITVPTYHDGSLIAPNAAGIYEVSNTATVSAMNVDPTPEHTGTATVPYTVPWERPELSKTVADGDEPVDAGDDPDSSAAGQPGASDLEYTIEVVVPDNDPLTSHDLWISDIVPHGIVVDPGSLAVACAGSCDGTSASLGLIHTRPDWSQEYGFWLGDVGAGGATFTVTYTASVAEFFNDGSVVLGNASYFYDHDGDPDTPDLEQSTDSGLVNEATLYWNAPPIVGGVGNSPDYDDNTPYTDDDADPSTRPLLDDSDGDLEDDAAYIVETPLLTLDKEAARYRTDRDDPYTVPVGADPIDFGLGTRNTNTLATNGSLQLHDPDDTFWAAADVGDWFLFSVTVPNSGVADAFDIEFFDDLTADGALVIEPSTIETSVAGVATPGICTFDDGGTPLNPGATNPPITPRADAADDQIDCSFAGPLAPGEEIVLTYWAQTQHSSELVPYLSAGTWNADRAENIADVTRYTATSGGAQAWDTGDDSVEFLIYSPIPDLNASFLGGSAVCETTGDDDATTSEITYRLNYSNRGPWNQTWLLQPWANAITWNGQNVPLLSNSVYGDPSNVGYAWDAVWTVTLPVGATYVAGTSEWRGSRPSSPQTALPEPVISTVAGRQVLTWDAADPAVAAVVRSPINPVYYPYVGNYTLYSGDIEFGVSTTPGEQLWTSTDTLEANLTFEDQLGEIERSGAVNTFDYIEDRLTGCGNRPSSYFRKSPDIWSPTQINDNTSIDDGADWELFTLRLHSYGDLNGVYFVDTLPSGLVFAGDAATADFAQAPTTNIPVASWPAAAQASGDLVDAMTVDYSTLPGPTISWGPFDLPDNNGATYDIVFPVGRIDPLPEPMWDSTVQNVAFIGTGDPAGGFTQVGGLRDDGEMHLPGPPGVPSVNKTVTNLEDCNPYGNSTTSRCGLYGDVVDIQIEVDLPRRLRADHLVLYDPIQRFSTNRDPDFGPAANITVTCYEIQGGVRVAGCDGDDDGVEDVVPVQLATQPTNPTFDGGTGTDDALGWYLGSFTEDPADDNDRVLVVQFELPSPDLADVRYASYSTLVETNNAYLHFDDGNDAATATAWNNFWSAYDPVDDLGPNGAGEGVDWITAITDTGINVPYAVDSLSDTVTYAVGYPVLNVSKKCVPVNPPAADWLNGSYIQEVGSGQANIECSLSVSNSNRGWDAIGVSLTDDPALDNDEVFHYPNEGGTSSLDANWSIVSVTDGAGLLTSPFAPSYPFAMPAVWEFDVPADETVEITYQANVAFVDEVIGDGDEVRISNVARINSWTDDPDQYSGGTIDEPNGIGTPRTRVSYIYAQLPEVNVSKLPTSVVDEYWPEPFGWTDGNKTNPPMVWNLLHECDRSTYGSTGTDDVHSCIERFTGDDWYDSIAPDHAELIPSSVQNWTVLMEVRSGEEMSEIVLTDSLPAGLSYVPGSAMLAPYDGTASYSIPEPVVVAGDDSCAPGDQHADGGDTISWTFTPDATDAFLSQPFSTTEGSFDAAGWGTRDTQYGHYAVITFDVEVADLDTMMACLDDLGEWEWHENNVTIEATSTEPGYEDLALDDEAHLDVPFVQDIELRKLPDNALEASGTTPEFVVEITNHSALRTYTALEIVDHLQMTDPLNTAAAGTATAETVYSLLPGFEPSFTETSFSATPAPNSVVDVTWEIPVLPPDTQIVIRMPIASDRDTPTGSLWENEVTLDSPNMHSTLDDEADITLTRPSPPPPVDKTGAVIGTIGSEELVEVTAVLEPGEPWLDLALVDQMPDGLVFLDYRDVSCAYTSGPLAGTGCADGFVQNMTPEVDAIDGTTDIGWWLGDVGGDAVNERTFTFVYRVRVADTYADGTPVVDGDTLTNTVLSVSNDFPAWEAGPTEDLLDPSLVLAEIADGGYSYTPETDDHVYEIAEPRLSVAKDVEILDGESPLEVGDRLLYTVTITNEGDWPAYMVRVGDEPSSSAVIDNATFAETVDDGTGPLAYGPASVVDGWTEGDPAIGWFVTVIGAAGTADGSDVVTLTYEATVTSDFIFDGLGFIENVAGVGSYQNDASVFTDPGRTYDPPPEAETSLPVSGPEIDVEKYVGDCASESENVAPGSISTWCLVVENTGEVTAYDVELFELLPAGWSYEAGSARLSVTPTGIPAGGATVEPTVTPIAGEELLSWNLGDLDPGHQVTILIDSHVDPRAPQFVVNTTSVRSKARVDDGLGGYELVAMPLGVPGYRDADVAGKRLLRYEMEIAKGVGESYDPAQGVIDLQVEPDCAAGPGDPGGCEITWYIVVNNPGLNPITGLEIVDELPAGMTYVPGTASADVSMTETLVAPGGPGGITEIVWEIDSLDGGDVALITVPVTIDEGQDDGTVFLNTAAMTSNEIPDVVANQAKVVINDFIPPTLDKTADVGSLTVGEVVEYTVSVTLPGPQNLNSVVVVDRLPAGLGYLETLDVSCTSGCDAWVEPVEIDSLVNDDTTTDLGWWFGDLDDLPTEGMVAEITYAAVALDTMVDAGALTNQATVLASIDPGPTDPPAEPPVDPDPSGPWDHETPAATADVEVFAPVLALDKDVSCDAAAEPGDGTDECEVAAGDELTFTLTVTNTGTWPAYDVTLVDNMPDGLTDAAVGSDSPGELVREWSAADTTMEWFFTGPLEPGESWVITYDATVGDDAEGAIENTAEVTSFWGTPEEQRLAAEATFPNADFPDAVFPEYAGPPADVNVLTVLAPAEPPATTVPPVTPATTVPPVTPAAPPATPPVTPAPSSPLPFTGADSKELGWIGAGLFGLGFLAIVGARRRREDS